MSLTIQVALFASAREAVGSKSMTVQVPAPYTVKQLLETLSGDARLAPLIHSLRVAVDEEFAEDSLELNKNMQVALIPPVSGGSSAVFQVLQTPLRVDDVVAAVTTPSHGAIVTFVGVVRNETAKRSVTRLEYESYEAMAEKKMASIAAEVQAKWPGVLVAAHHRVGVLEPTEVAVVLAVSAPHRHVAFQACEFFIERLKQDVPIWKKEVFRDGEVWVASHP
jgi:MoaE-MoaD fusion protein